MDRPTRINVTGATICENTLKIHSENWEWHFQISNSNAIGPMITMYLLVLNDFRVFLPYYSYVHFENNSCLFVIGYLPSFIYGRTPWTPNANPQTKPANAPPWCVAHGSHHGNTLMIPTPLLVETWWPIAPSPPFLSPKTTGDAPVSYSTVATKTADSTHLRWNLTFCKHRTSKIPPPPSHCRL